MDVRGELSDLKMLHLGQLNLLYSQAHSNATSSVKPSWNSLLGFISPFLCLPNFGYACITW